MRENRFPMTKIPYIDLRTREDDKTIIKNPHQGWYIHYIDNGVNRKYYRDGIAKGDYLEDFPCLNHLYLRVDWADIETEEGKFDWSYMDSIFDEWGPHGYTFSFRFCCYEAGDFYATPKWVRDAGANGTDVLISAENDTNRRYSWEPDYSDPIFLEKLENFMREVGRKYNGDPRVEYIDIGTYGTWGEGHTFCGTRKNWDFETLKKHVDMHLKYLPDTILMLNDDMCKTVIRGEGAEKGEEFARYCTGKGIGVRDDSICVTGCCREFGYDTVQIPELFEMTYDTAPVDIEYAHFASVSDDCIRECFPFAEAMKNTHATFAGFHGYPRLWLEKHKYFTEYAANRLGYWYFINGIELPECVSGLKSVAKLDIENRGFAVSYHPFTLKIRAVGENGTFDIFTAERLNLGWKPSSVTRENVVLDFKDVPHGEYRIELGLFSGEKTIKIAMQEKYCRDGWYELANTTVTEI